MQFRKLVTGGDLDGSGFKGSETMLYGAYWQSSNTVKWENGANAALGSIDITLIRRPL